MKEKNITARFIELCKINSPSRGEKSIASYLKKWARDNGLHCAEDRAGKKLSSNSNNLYISGRKHSFKNPQLVLCAHMDTISDTAKIRIRSSAGKICAGGDTVLGADDKAGIAVIMQTVQTLKKRNTLKDTNLMCFFSVCEESGLRGAAHCDMSMFNKKSFVYVLDSELPVGTVITKAPYLDKFSILVKGKSSHAGIDPEKGKSSIKAAAYLINKLPQGKIDRETTFNIGIINGGNKINVVPELTVIRGEIRSHKYAKIRDISDRLSRVCKNTAKLYNEKISFFREPVFKGFDICSGHPIVKTFKKATGNAGIRPGESFSNGGSDANVFNDKRIYSVNIGTGFRYPHSEKEYIRPKDLKNGAKIIIELCALFSKKTYFV
ncbi:MAG: M20/M25/M40 family metallo-hydrolase [bacterium]|nr:M20/M25/M40 family metallo-hydrolase [bacterium]